MKILLSGAALSLVAGVLLGGAMKPNLEVGDDRPAGPQTVAAWATGRSTGPFDPGMALADYHGVVPDYVMGTDWKKTATWPQERAAVSPPREVVRDDEPPVETPQITRVAYEEPRPAPHAYPSLGADRPEVIDVPAPEPAPAPEG